MIAVPSFNICHRYKSGQTRFIGAVTWINLYDTSQSTPSPILRYLKRDFVINANHLPIGELLIVGIAPTKEPLYIIRYNPFKLNSNQCAYGK